MLLIGLILVQASGLAIHAMDRIGVPRLAQRRSLPVRVAPDGHERRRRDCCDRRRSKTDSMKNGAVRYDYLE